MIVVDASVLAHLVFEGGSTAAARRLNSAGISTPPRPVWRVPVRLFPASHQDRV